MAVNLFAKYDGCYLIAKEVRNEIIDKMVNKAKEFSKENLDEIESLALINKIISVGNREFERNFKEKIKQDQDIKDLVDLIIISNKRYFGTEFYTSEILQKILKNAII